MATRTFQRRPAAGLDDPQQRIADLVARQGSVLMRIARQWSLCSEDAQDAYQRALEIYIRRVETLDPTTEAAWLKVVVKHEALAVRRARQESVTPEEIDFDTYVPLAQRSIEDRFESTERVSRSAEVMRRLKPDEATALMLKAEGLSYSEIGMRQGWTYTKVNRCITEGRRRFMMLYEQLEAGAECERVNPTLVALAHGNATSEALLDIRPHLRNCAACRATVRKLHASRWKRLAAFFPFPAVIGPVRGWIEKVSGRGGPASELPGTERLEPMDRQQELDEAFRRINSGEAAVQPAIPTAVQHIERIGHSRLNLRSHLEAALHRLQSSDLALGLQATSSGGGRAASLAAVLGVCVSGAGAGTYCVATALLPDPKPIRQTQSKSPDDPPADAKLTRLPAPAMAAASPTPQPEPQRPAQHKPAARRASSSQSTPKVTPVSHEQAPVSPAPAGTQDFSFEQSAAPAAAQPAAAPATGGGEFGP